MTKSTIVKVNNDPAMSYVTAETEDGQTVFVLKEKLPEEDITGRSVDYKPVPIGGDISAFYTGELVSEAAINETEN
jgi:hypothetical protein